MPNRSSPPIPAPIAGRFDLQGHRGARGLWPENTLPGFAATLGLGVSSIECDVVMTADGVPVVYHDLALNPDLARDRTGRWIAPPGAAIASLHAADLAAFDVGRARPGSRVAARFPRQAAQDGARIPTLAEVCALLRGSRVRLDIEIKPGSGGAAAVAAVLAVVDSACCASQVSFRSFDWRVLARLRLLRPQAPLAWLTPALPRIKAAAVAAEVARGGWPDWRPVWAPDHRTLLKPDIAQAHDAGLAVVPYTVNRARRMVQLAAWGVDGFCTDCPDIAHVALPALLAAA